MTNEAATQGSLTAGALQALCDARDTRLLRALYPVYGSDRALLDERIALMRAVLAAYLRRFGDEPVRIFRCPGRINVRGMHVDTHGGFLNLMTHQREVLVAVHPTSDPSFVLGNADPVFEETEFTLSDWRRHPAFEKDWHSFITHPEIQGSVLARRGHWRNYLEGCALRVQHRWHGEDLTGMRGVVGSDLPRGAALSSSTALSMALLAAIVSCNRLDVDQDTLILLGKEAEWYTGARGGMSDQAAMVLGGLGALINIAIRPERLDTSSARRIAFPDDLRILVINSFTERSLSGAQLVEYTRNRFAYSLAMEILRQEMRRMGLDAALVDGLTHLSSLAPSNLEAAGGAKVLYAALLRIPESIEISELRARYTLPHLDALYDQYFGTALPEQRPARIALRGPLLFGIAESERARVFVDALEEGHYARAGALMSRGHDGDRLRCADGSRYHCDIGNTAIERLARAGTPIEECPGVYGASSAALDCLVDAALKSGALGASLTGAGIAGTVLALCRAQDSELVAGDVRRVLASPDYAREAGLRVPPSPEDLRDAVVVNQSVASVGEVVFG